MECAATPSVSRGRQAQPRVFDTRPAKILVTPPASWRRDSVVGSHTVRSAGQSVLGGRRWRLLVFLRRRAPRKRTPARARRRRCHRDDQADDGVLSIRRPEVSLGSPEVDWSGAMPSPHIRGRFQRQIHISKVEGMVHDAVDAPSTMAWRRSSYYPASTPPCSRRSRGATGQFPDPPR